MPERLRGRTALVTGATSGIGRATAHRLAAEGAHVDVGGRDVRRGAEVVVEITDAGGRAVFLPADLAAVVTVLHTGDPRERDVYLLKVASETCWK